MPRKVLISALALLLPAASWAGRPDLQPAPVPALNELGLLTLGVSLLAVGGLALLRRRSN